MEDGWTPTLRRSPWSCQRTIQRSQVAAMRALQEEMVVIQVPQMETRIRVVMMTPMHQEMRRRSR
jgi:hypothetical protein